MITIATPADTQISIANIPARFTIHDLKLLLEQYVNIPSSMMRIVQGTRIMGDDATVVDNIRYKLLRAVSAPTLLDVLKSIKIDDTELLYPTITISAVDNVVPTYTKIVTDEMNAFLILLFRSNPEDQLEIPEDAVSISVDEIILPYKFSQEKYMEKYDEVTILKYKFPVIAGKKYSISINKNGDIITNRYRIYNSINKSIMFEHKSGIENIPMFSDVDIQWE